MRATFGALAVILTAWFALVSVQARDTDVATNIINGPAPPAARARQARDLLDTAAILSPDREVDLLRSQLAHSLGDNAQARRLAAAVTRSEPDNAEAWFQLIRVSTGPKVAGELQHLGSLVPTVTTSP
jgi:hypothetical protein